MSVRHWQWMKTLSRRFVRSCKQFYYCDIRAAEQTNIHQKHTAEQTPVCVEVTWCVKVLCRSVLVYVQVRHQTMQSMWLAASHQVIWQPREVQCREINQEHSDQTKRKKSFKRWTGSVGVCGRGHISVSANKLSPRPDVSKTIWGLESVGLKNDTFRKGPDRHVPTFLKPVNTNPADHFPNHQSLFSLISFQAAILFLWKSTSREIIHHSKC